MALLAEGGDPAEGYAALRLRLVGWFKKRKFSQAEADDMADAVIFQVAKFAERGEIRQLSAYAHAVARSLLIRRFRKAEQHDAKVEAVRQALYSEVLPDEPFDDPRWASVREALAELRPRRRRLLLDYFGCEDLKERAELHEWYGWSRRVMVGRVSRAVCQLRQLVLEHDRVAVPAEQDVPDR